MKKLATVPALALLIAACSEGPVAPAVDAPQYLAEHGSIPAPTILSASVVGDDVVLEWEWSDEDPWDLVSFTVKRDGDNVAGEPTNAKPYAAGAPLVRSHSDYAVEDGTYEYCVEVMAKYFSSAQSRTLTHHNRSCTTVVVGAAPAHEIVRIAAANNATETPTSETIQLRKSGAFTIWAVLYENGSLVADCTTLPLSAVGATISFTSPGSSTQTVVASECAWNGAAGVHRYKFELANAFNNQASSGTLEFRVNGVVVTTYNFSTN